MLVPGRSPRRGRLASNADAKLAGRGVHSLGLLGETNTVLEPQMFSLSPYCFASFFSLGLYFYFSFYRYFWMAVSLVRCFSIKTYWRSIDVVGIFGVVRSEPKPVPSGGSGPSHLPSELPPRPILRPVPRDRGALCLASLRLPCYAAKLEGGQVKLKRSCRSHALGVAAQVAVAL